MASALAHATALLAQAGYLAGQSAVRQSQEAASSYLSAMQLVSDNPVALWYLQDLHMALRRMGSRMGTSLEYQQDMCVTSEPLHGSGTSPGESTCAGLTGQDGRSASWHANGFVSTAAVEHSTRCRPSQPQAAKTTVSDESDGACSDLAASQEQCLPECGGHHAQEAAALLLRHAQHNDQPWS